MTGRAAKPERPYPTSLGIIPARGGSKGVLRKNIRSVAGRPLIAYTIDAANNSKSLTRFVISTEDDEIASIGRSLGCEVIQRPNELAGDAVPMVPVVLHAFSSVEKSSGVNFEYGVILQPTAPLRTGDDIDSALRLLFDTAADSVVSVDQVSDYHPSRMYRLENEKLVQFAPEPPGQLRQDLPPVYHRNGAIYCFRRTLVEQEDTLLGPDTRPYVMPAEKSINIDAEFDLLLVDLVLSNTEKG